MKYILSFILLIYPFYSYPFTNFIELSYLSPSNFQVTLSKLKLGELELDGQLFCNVRRGKNFFLYNTRINNFAVGDISFKPMEARVIIKERAVVINYIRNREFLIRGKIDFSQNKLALNINFDTFVVSENFSGKVKGILCVEGKLSNPLFKGELFIRDGRYLGTDFSEAKITFIGFWPYVRLNNSEVKFSNGTRYEMDGFVDAQNLKTIFSSPKFTSKETSLGEWKVFTKERDVGFTKEIDERMGVLFGSYINKNEEELGAEFRYKISDDKFLRLRMEKDEAMLGFERRKEF